MTDILQLLKQIRDSRETIKDLNRIRESLRESLYPRAITYDGDKVQTSPEDRMTEVMSKLHDLDDHFAVRRSKLIEDIQIAEQVINAMPTVQYQRLLYLRYFADRYDGKNMEWADVGNEMGYSEVYVRGELHGKAVAEARDVYHKLHTQPYTQ